MGSIYGRKIRVSIFGESHGKAVGAVIDGLPPGFTVDEDELQAFMDRRAPGRDKLSTQRKEDDIPEILSGVFNRKTCGTPLALIIKNNDTRSSDYDDLKNMPRPGHADYTNHIKYEGYEDYRSGGHSSGRLTAAMTAAGGTLKQLLSKKGIDICAELIEVGGRSENWDALIEEAKKEGDSLGGIIECRIQGLPPGLGDPIFDGVENRIAQTVFGIPAVKGIEFGEGFAAAKMKGSENNDDFCRDEEGRIRTATNNHGGILGGITSGEDIVFRVAFKPTPSIAKVQKTVNYEGGEQVEIQVKGRHDPCVARRAAPVVEAAAALAIADICI